MKPSQRIDQLAEEKYQDAIRGAEPEYLDRHSGKIKEMCLTRALIAYLDEQSPVIVITSPPYWDLADREDLAKQFLAAEIKGSLIILPYGSKAEAYGTNFVEIDVNGTLIRGHLAPEELAKLKAALPLDGGRTFSEVKKV